MVEGAFARAFRSELQPVEVASAVQREMDDRAAIVAKGRTLVPNDFVVELAESDHERLDVYAESLGVELANLARDYAKEQGYSFVGPVRMRFEGVPDITTGTFRIRSGVIRGSTIEDGEIRLPASDLPRTQGRGFPGHPRLLVSGPGAPGDPAGGEQHTYELQTPVTLLGRGTDCDLRLVDPGVSRHHAELRVENDQVVLVDLELHERHLRQRPADQASGAHRRDPGLAGPDHADLPARTARTARMARALLTRAPATRVQGRSHR